MQKRVAAWILALAMVLVAMGALAEAPAADRAGNPLVLPEKIETVVSLAPSVTQVLVDLGLADKLVLVDTYSQGMEGVPAGLPGIDMMAPDMETLLAMAPDLVFVSGMTLVDDGGRTLEQLQQLGVVVAFIPSSNTIADIMLDNQFIGDVMGDPEGAAALNAQLIEALEAFAPEGSETVSVYFEISPAPYLYSFGSGVFLNEMIERLGGVNILADQHSWLSVSEEAVIQANPQVIFTNVSWEGDAVAEILARPGWQGMDAVKNGRVYLIDADSSSQPNHRIIKALSEMAAAIQEE